MLFSEFSKYLQDIETNPARLKKTSILATLLNSLSHNEIPHAMYLSLGYLQPPFKSQKFNIAEKTLINSVAIAANTDTQEVQQKLNKIGDLGDVCEELLQSKSSSDLNISEVHERLTKIAQFEGNGSVELKVNEAATLLSKLKPISAKYVCRIILGTTRLGFTEKTITDALALTQNDKKLKKEIEKKWSIHPDIGYIAQIILKKGPSGLDEINITPGIPVLAQKPQRSGGPKEIFEKVEDPWAEFKFDGTRVQMHILNGEVKTFARNLDETTHQFPEIIQAASKLNIKNAIIDGEAIGWDLKKDKALPFQVTIQRKRKHNVSEVAQDIPLRFYAFDLLYLNGASLINEPLKFRKEKLTKIFIQDHTLKVTQHKEISNSADLTDYFNESKDKKLEGLIVKNANSPYQAGARSYAWVKLKVADETLLDDTIDCVIIGFYYGKGSRAKFGIGGFLAGIIDSDTQEIMSLTKVGTGITDSDFEKLKTLVDKFQVSDSPYNLKLEPALIPDIWVNPNIIVELGADEISKSSSHTSGYALRFPRLLKFREDKNLSQITSVEEVKNLYNLQNGK